MVTNLELPTLTPPPAETDSGEYKGLWINTGRIIIDDESRKLIEFRPETPNGTMEQISLRRYYGHAPSPLGWIEFMCGDAKTVKEAYANFNEAYQMALVQTYQMNVAFQQNLQQAAMEKAAIQQVKKGFKK